MAKPPLPMPPLEKLRQILSYDPDTGAFTWLKHWIAKKVGASAVLQWTVPHGNTYNIIIMDGKKYLAHRVAYFMMTGKEPPPKIDHIDNNGLNNRWNNLRPATHAQNLWNAPTRKHSLSGLKGVRQQTRNGKTYFFARITVNHKKIYLGSFKTAEEAHAAYVAAAHKYFGEFARAA